MGFQLCRNILSEIEQMGFRITWKFISIGLFGCKEIENQISYDEMFEYLDILLEKEDEAFDDIITLLCVKNNEFELELLIKELADNDQSEYAFELHKWRVCLLKKILDNKNEDALQGLLELMEFWLPIKDEVDCPHVFPENTGNKEAVHNYFTETMYIYLINENQMWIEKEIKKIRRVELGRRPLTPIRSRGM